MAYSKLHASIIGSSLWTEGDSIRILFITLLAMCDKDGCVYGTQPGISRIAMIDPEEADGAWQALMSPDKHSSDRMRAPENEGRRIEEIPGGFRLLNFDYYRGLRNEDDRREQNRIAQARFKARHKDGNQGKPQSATVSRGKPQKAHTDTEAEADADADAETVLTHPHAPTARGVYSPDFDKFWEAYPKRLGKGGAWKAWKITKPDLQTVLNSLSGHRQSDQWKKNGGQFIPHPATWLNNRGWDDDLESLKCHATNIPNHRTDPANLPGRYKNAI